MRKVSIPKGGWFRPNRIYNPSDARGKALNITGFEIISNTYRTSSSPVTEATDWGGSSYPNRMVFPYVAASGAVKLLYINYQSLLLLNTATSTYSTITASMFSGTPTTKCSAERFRSKFLIGTQQNGLWWYDPVTETARKCGVAAPSSAPSGAAGAAASLTGNYKLKYTYVDDQGHESNPSPASSGVSVTSQEVDWSGITVGPTGTVKRRLYRTIANGDIYLYLGEINDNTTTTYSNDTLADSSLGSRVETDNDVPPNNITAILGTSKRFYLVDASDGLTVCACKTSTVTADPNYQAYPQAFRVKVPAGGALDQIVALFEMNGVVHVATRFKVYALHGDVAGAMSTNTVFDFGFFHFWAHAKVEGGIVFMDSNKRVMFWNGGDKLEDLGYDIQSLLNTCTTGGAGAFPAHPCIVYDVSKASILVSLVNTTVPTYTFMYSLLDKQWGNPRWLRADYAYLVDNNTMYAYGDTGTVDGDLYSIPTSLTPSGRVSAAVTLPTIRLHPFWLQDQESMNVARIGIEARGENKYSTYRPLLIAYLGFDGNILNTYDPYFLDLCDDDLSINDAGMSRVLRYIPVHKNIKSLELQVMLHQSSVYDNVSIYDIFLELDEGEDIQVQTERHDELEV